MFFQFDELGISYCNEIIGGLMIFLFMVYILFVNLIIFVLESVKDFLEVLRID